jgi:hypothetical protein
MVPAAADAGALRDLDDAVCIYNICITIYIYIYVKLCIYI